MVVQPCSRVLRRSTQVLVRVLFCVQIEDIISTVRDSNLKLTLAFGIGMHHAGLHERDRKTVEELFVNSKIQVPEGGDQEPLEAARNHR